MAESPAMPPANRIPFHAPLSMAALIVVILVGMTLSFVPLRASHDEWWHLKTGKYVDEHGLPENEVFTYTAEAYPWHNHEWIAQVGLWRIYKAGELGDLGGIRAVILFKSLFFVATLLGLAAFLGWRTGQPTIAALSVLALAALSRRTLYPRPPFISYGLLALTLCLFIAWRDRKLRTRWLLVLPPLFALWTNLHGGWMAGLVLGGAFWLEAAVDWALARWRREDSQESRNRFLQATGIGIACGLATLVNPYGYHLYELSGRVLNDERLMGIINEMLPPHWRFVWALDGTLVLLFFTAVRPRNAKQFAGAVLAVLLLWGVLQGRTWFGPPESALAQPAAWETRLRLVLAAVLIGVTGARSKSSIGLALTLLGLFFAQQSIAHVRHLPLFGIVIAPVLASGLSDWVRGTTTHWKGLWESREAYPTGEALQAAILPQRWCLLHRSGFTLCVLVLVFYWALPEEAASIAASSAPLEERLRARSLVDRNLLLIRGQDESLNMVNEPGTELGAYPKAAVDFLVESRLPGRLWNAGNYAGYLMWRLSPERYKVFTDNRYDIYGGDFVQQQEIVNLAFEGNEAEEIPGWETVLDYWGVNTLFLGVNAPLHQHLIEQAQSGSLEWQPVWAQDGQFAIWTRSEPIPLPTQPGEEG